LLSKLRQSTQAFILLVEELIQKARSKLGQCPLDIATAKSTSGRCLLKHSLFTLSGQRLKDRALLLLRDISSLFFRATQSNRAHHRLKRRRASSNIRLKQPAKFFTGQPLFSSASFCGLHLLSPSPF
jgi:hypothetical protein